MAVYSIASKLREPEIDHRFIYIDASLYNILTIQCRPSNTMINCVILLQLVSSFLSESVSVTGDQNQVKQSQLYIG